MEVLPFLLDPVLKGKLLLKDLFLLPALQFGADVGALCVPVTCTPITMRFWLEDAVWLKATITTKNRPRAL